MNTHHELAPLLVAVGRAGIELALHPTDPTRLRHRPVDIPPPMRDGLRLYRTHLLNVLVSDYHPTEDDAAYVYVERLGIADELAMPTHRGSSAWLIAVGESMAAATTCPPTRISEIPRYCPTTAKPHHWPCTPSSRAEALRNRHHARN